MKSYASMIRPSITSVLLFLQGLGFSSSLCSGDLCFDWKVSNSRDQLTLSCKVENPNYRILIRDPRGNAQGDCLPLHPYPICESHFKNATFSLSYTTNIAMFQVRGNIDTSINGMWTCAHGTGHQLARCNVNISKPEDGCLHYCNYNNILAKNNETLFETVCQRDILLFSFGGYMLVVIMLIPFCVYRDQLCKKENKRFYFKRCKVFGSKAVTICRIIAFIFFSCLYFALCWCAASFINGICQFSQKWVLTTIGILTGIVLSALCLTKIIKIDSEPLELFNEPDEHVHDVGLLKQDGEYDETSV